MGGAARDPTNCGLLRDAVLSTVLLSLPFYISVTCDYFMLDFMHNEQKNRCDELYFGQIVVALKFEET